MHQCPTSFLWAMHSTPCTPLHPRSTVMEQQDDGALRGFCRQTSTDDVYCVAETLHDDASLMPAETDRVLLRCTSTFLRDQACIQESPTTIIGAARGKSQSGPACPGPAWNTLPWLHDEQGSLGKGLQRLSSPGKRHSRLALERRGSQASPKGLLGAERLIK